VFLGLVIGVVWSLGISQLIFGQLNLITSFLIAILCGLGIDFGIHLLLRYKEEREAGKNYEEAIILMFRHTGVASFTSAVTTSFAFLVLYFSGFRAFQEFGVIAGVGILFTLLAMLFFMAPLLLLADERGLKIGSTRATMKLPIWLWKKPKVILAITIALVLAAVYNFTKIGLDYDFTRLTNYKNLRSYELGTEVDAMFRSSMTPSVIIAKDSQDEKRLIDAIQADIEKHQGEKDYRIDKVLGLTTFVPKRQYEKLKIIARIERLLNKNKKYEPLLKKGLPSQLRRIKHLLSVKRITIDTLPNSLRKKFRPNRGKNSIVLIFPRANLNNGKHVVELANQLHSIKIDDKPLEVAADSLIFAEILTLIQQDGIFILVAAFIGVFILVWLNFKKLGQSLIVLIPIVVGIFLMAGALGLFSVKLDFINVLVFPIMVGIGIDSAVHIFHRFLETDNIIFAVRLLIFVEDARPVS